MDELELDATTGDGVNFIPCLRWVRRGVAKAEPEQVRLTREDLQKAIDDAAQGIGGMEVDDNGDEEDDDGDDGDKEDGGEVEEDNDDEYEDLDEDEAIAKKYGLDEYDDDKGEEEGARLNLGDLVTLSGDQDLDQDDDKDSASDAEDMAIHPTDNLILVGHVEGGASVLEVYVYNDEEGALYVHHDMLLPHFPLALEWLSYEPGEKVKGNLVAVGSMSPRIDVWDLDMVNCLEPAFSLGSENKKKTKKKKNLSKSRRKRQQKEEGGDEEDGHSDAVLSLAWNHHVEHVLASGSVDETVLLWDLSQGKVAKRLTQHREKVQALQWHPFEAQSLLTGCCDKQVRLFDCRGDGVLRSWEAEGEVERVLWNHFDPFAFFASTDSGHVQQFDVRREGKPVWTLGAHSASVNGLSLSSQCPGCLVTVSSDKALKVWDVASQSGRPECVLEREMNLGELHSVDGCPDAPFVVCAGGDLPRDNLRVWDVREAADVRSRFGDRQLENPLKASSFGFSTVNEAEVKKEEEEAEVQMKEEPVEVKQEPGIKQEPSEASSSSSSNPHVSGGAAGKFRKKEKAKKAKLKIKKEF